MLSVHFSSAVKLSSPIPFTPDCHITLHARKFAETAFSPHWRCVANEVS